jgi:hypothetical protein
VFLCLNGVNGSGGGGTCALYRFCKNFELQHIFLSEKGQLEIFRDRLTVRLLYCALFL